MKPLFALSLLLSIPLSVEGQLQWQRIFDHDAEGATNPGSVPPARNKHALGYYGRTDTLILFGGESGSDRAPYGDTWLFFISNSTWFKVEAGPSPPERADSVFGVIESCDIFVVAFGTNVLREVDFEDVWGFNFNTRRWSQITPTGAGPSRRYGAFGGVHFGSGKEFWVGGGFTKLTDNPSVYRANIDVYKLTFTNATSAQWMQLAGNPTEGNQYHPFLPHGRAYAASAVVTANRMAIYGGCLRCC